jgi:GTPase
MPKPNKDDVERLSRGGPTRTKIGSQGIGHRLTQKERLLFEAAKKHGFLKTPANGIRSNVINVYRLWCAAEGRNFIIKSGSTR